VTQGEGTPFPLLYRAAAMVVASAFLMNAEVVLIRFMDAAVPVALILFVRAGAQLLWVAPDILRHGAAAR
jgi:hypothetical protein